MHHNSDPKPYLDRKTVEEQRLEVLRRLRAKEAAERSYVQANDTLSMMLAFVPEADRAEIMKMKLPDEVEGSTHAPQKLRILKSRLMTSDEAQRRGRKPDPNSAIQQMATLLEAYADGLTHDEFKEALKDSPLSEMLENGAKTYYSNAGKLASRGLAVKHGDKFYSPKTFVSPSSKDGAKKSPHRATDGGS